MLCKMVANIAGADTKSNIDEWRSWTRRQANQSSLASHAVKASTKNAKIRNYRAPPVTLRLSMRLRSCSKAIVLESEDIGAGTAAEAGAEDASCCSGFGFGFAETDAGTKDIIVVAGLGAAAGEAFAVGLA